MQEHESFQPITLGMDGNTTFDWFTDAITQFGNGRNGDRAKKLYR